MSAIDTTGGVYVHMRKTAAILALSILLLTACGGAATAAYGTNRTVTTASTASHRKLTPVPGGIVDGLFEEPNLLNPILGPSMGFATNVEMTMFRNLFVILPNGTIAPDLATVVPSLKNGGISKNGLVYTFHLKPNADWSNGQPVTSQDVVTTWKLIMNPKLIAASTTGWTEIKTIRVISQKTFQVVLKTPYAPLLVTCLGGIPTIVPSSVFGHMSAQQVNTAAFNHDPSVTDGPFMFKSVGSSATDVLPAPCNPAPKNITRSQSGRRQKENVRPDHQGSSACGPSCTGTS